jgi:hypothetical protein
MKKLIHLLKDARSFHLANSISLLYFVFYLWSVGNIQFGKFEPAFNAVISPNAASLLGKTIAPWLWESIGFVRLGIVEIYISPLNILVASILSTLIFFNILVAAYSYRLGRTCNIKTSGWHGLLGFLPGFLTGFACCVPTFIIALGSVASGFTVFFIGIRPYFIPTAVLIMIWGYWWSMRRITPGLIDRFERTKKAR